MNIEAMQQNAAAASRLLRTMSNEKRLMILCQLSEGERSVTELAELLAVRHSTVSQHLALLRRNRLVRARREAQTQYYSLAGAKASTLIRTLYRLYCTPAEGGGSRSSPKRAA